MKQVASSISPACVEREMRNDILTTFLCSECEIIFHNSVVHGIVSLNMCHSYLINAKLQVRPLQIGVQSVWHCALYLSEDW